MQRRAAASGAGREATNAAASTHAAKRMPSRFVFAAPASSTAAAASRQPAASRSHRASEQCRDDDEDVEEDVGLSGASSRSPKRGTTRTSRSGGQRSHAGRVPMEQPGSGRDGADDEEPELHVQRDDVRAAHRVEGGGVEDRAAAAGTTRSAWS